MGIIELRDQFILTIILVGLFGLFILMRLRFNPNNKNTTITKNDTENNDYIITDYSEEVNRLFHEDQDYDEQLILNINHKIQELSLNSSLKLDCDVFSYRTRLHNNRGESYYLVYSVNGHEPVICGKSIMLIAGVNRIEYEFFEVPYGKRVIIPSGRIIQDVYLLNHQSLEGLYNQETQSLKIIG